MNLNRGHPLVLEAVGAAPPPVGPGETVVQCLDRESQGADESQRTASFSQTNRSVVSLAQTESINERLGDSNTGVVRERILYSSLPLSPLAHQRQAHDQEEDGDTTRGAAGDNEGQGGSGGAVSENGAGGDVEGRRDVNQRQRIRYRAPLPPQVRRV